MRCLNENIARRSNAEDGCGGRFWEGRFKCQRLLDEASILACMAYVDLNPVRAQLAKTPEQSEFTSIFDRIEARQAKAKLKELRKWKKQQTLTSRQEKMFVKEKEKQTQADWLCRLGIDKNGEGLLSLSENEYIELLDWTGRKLHAKKRGAIPAELQAIFERLEIDQENWLTTVTRYGKWFYRIVGSLEAIAEAAQSAGRAWFKGMSGVRSAFGKAEAKNHG